MTERTGTECLRCASVLILKAPRSNSTPSPATRPVTPGGIPRRCPPTPAARPIRLDLHQDGYSNLDEFLAGTDPKNAASSLALEAFASVDGTVVVRFQSVDGRTYTVQRRDALSTDDWIVLHQVPAQGSAGTVTLPAGTASDRDRYFRVLTPAIP